MSQDLIISGRKKDLGGFSVSRTLPSVTRRQLGPFVFLDHMGPMIIDETHVLDVRPHPHIGLSTVTYLFAGRGYHRDNLGSKQVIVPGDLNWMTAGRGISHSERTPEEDRNPSEKNEIHGIQIWIGLPREHEDCEPSFTHYPKSQLPKAQAVKDLDVQVLIGEFNGVTSPVKTHSRTLFMDLNCRNQLNTKLEFSEEEIGIFLISGSCRINEHDLQTDDLFIPANPKSVQLTASKDTKLIVIGGTPFPEDRHIWWNFVSSDKAKIRAAAARWKNQEFGKIEGETEFIPLPEYPI